MNIHLIKQENGYSTYENKNEKVKKAIQMYASQIDQLLTEDEKLNAINNKFKVDIVKVFEEHFLGFASRINEKIIGLTTDYLSHYNNDNTYQSVSLCLKKESYKYYFSHRRYYSYNDSYSIEFEPLNIGICNGHVYFNINGDIVNRDYNCNFNEKHDYMTLDNVWGDILKRLDESKIDFSKIYVFKNIYFFGETYCVNLISDCRSFEFYPNNSTNSYYIPGESYSKITKPKSAKETTKEIFLNHLKQSIFNEPSTNSNN